MIALQTAGCGSLPGSLEYRRRDALSDLQFYQSRIPSVEHPLTLQDVLRFADAHNLQAWIASHESRIQKELATSSTLAMMPSLLSGFDYRERSQFDASSSQSFETGEQSLEPSISSIKRNRTFDISLTWNLLDFGISFVRSRQQAGRVAMAEQNERRVRQDLHLDVTRAYWRAVTTRATAEAADRLAAQILVATAQIRQQVEDKTISPLDGLRRETWLLERHDELRRYRNEFVRAKIELAEHMGWPPGRPFILAEVDFSTPIAPEPLNVESLEWEALQSRPELFEKDLEQSISRDEAHIALARVFPIPTLSWRLDYDDNPFLIFHTWNTVGLRAAWDLLAIPFQLKQHDAAKLETELIRKQRIAIAAAILTQVHLALLDYRTSLEDHEHAETIASKQEALRDTIRSLTEQGKASGADVLQHEIQHHKARANSLRARADLMIASARIFNSIGRPFREAKTEATEIANDVQSDAMSADEGKNNHMNDQDWQRRILMPSPSRAPVRTDQPPVSPKTVTLTAEPAMWMR